jgi:hypothetical protein
VPRPGARDQRYVVDAWLSGVESGAFGPGLRGRGVAAVLPAHRPPMNPIGGRTRGGAPLAPPLPRPSGPKSNHTPPTPPPHTQRQPASTSSAPRRAARLHVQRASTSGAPPHWWSRPPSSPATRHVGYFMTCPGADTGLASGARILGR